MKRLIFFALVLFALIGCVDAYTYNFTHESTDYGIIYSNIASAWEEDTVNSYAAPWIQVSKNATPPLSHQNETFLIRLDTTQLEGFPNSVFLSFELLSRTEFYTGMQNITYELYTIPAYDNETVTWANTFTSGSGEFQCDDIGTLLMEMDGGRWNNETNLVYVNFTNGTLLTDLQSHYAGGETAYYCIQPIIGPNMFNESAVFPDQWYSINFNANYPTGLFYEITAPPAGDPCTVDANCTAGGILKFCDQLFGVCRDNNMNLSVENNSIDGGTNNVYLNWSLVSPEDLYFVEYDTSYDNSQTGGFTVDAPTRNLTLYSPNTSIVKGAINYYQVNAYLNYAKIGQSFIMNVTPPECIISNDCGIGFVCVDYQCQQGENQCDYLKADSNCENSSEYCDTFSQSGNTCQDKNSLNEFCYRNHMCLSGNCTAHDDNDEYGDYPLYFEYGGEVPYDSLGLCVDENSTSCDVNADCNESIEFCQLFPLITEPNGICTEFVGEGEYCDSSDWCNGSLSCVSHTCTDVSGGEQCDSDNYWIYNNNENDKVFYDCDGQGVDGFCGVNGTNCYCGRNSTTDTNEYCLPRNNYGQGCLNPLYDASLDPIEEKEEENKCAVGLQCMNLKCYFNSFECAANQQCPGLDTPAYYDAYCPITQYCDGTTFTCKDRIVSGYACGNTNLPFGNDQEYSCLSCDCQETEGGNVCVGDSGLFETQIDFTIGGKTEDFTFNPDQQIAVTLYYQTTDFIPIEGATCTFTTPGMQDSTNNTISLFDDGDGFYWSWFTTKNSEDTHAFVIRCDKTGYDSSYYTGELTISGSVDASDTRLNWFNTPGNSFDYGDVFTYQVAYEYNAGLYWSKIPDASCIVEFSSSDDTEYTGPTLIEYDNYYAAPMSALIEPDVYETIITCSATGYDTLTLSHTWRVQGSSTCNNKIKDGDETGVDCGGSCDPCPPTPDHCDNTFKDGDETDINCGGSCDPCENFRDCVVWGDCLSGYCASDNVCRDPSCNDGVQNQGETGIDRGGPCGVEYPCTITNDCSLDGSVVCSGKNNDLDPFEVGICAVSECNTNAECPDVIWRDGGGVIVTRPRVCDTVKDKCYFVNDTKIKRELIVSPLSGNIANSSGTRFYVGYCNDKTNGFTVLTTEETLKFYIIGTSGFTPSITADFRNLTFGPNTPTLSTSATIEKMCSILQGNDRAYASITLFGCGSVCRSQTVDAVTFLEAFYVNVTPIDGDVYQFAAPRNMTCYVRANNGFKWDQITGEASILNFSKDAYNLSVRFEWLCNNTFNEKKAGVKTLTAIGMTGYFIGEVIGVYMEALWPGFKFETWMLWLLGISVGILLPLFISLFLSYRRRGGKPNYYDRRGEL